MCDALPRPTPPSTSVLPEPKPRPAYPAGLNWHDFNRKLYRAGLNYRQRNRHRLWARAYVRNNYIASAAAADVGMTERNFERYKAKWRAYGIHVPTHNQRRKNHDKLSSAHPYALKATENPAFENTVAEANTVLRNTPQEPLESTVTGIEQPAPANAPPILPTMARGFTAAEKAEFSQKLHALLCQRRIRITPEECGKLLGIGLSRLPEFTGHTLFVFLAGRLRSSALRNPFAYAIRCILTRQRAGHSPPGTAPAADPCRPPIRPVDPSAALNQLRPLATASSPGTGKHRIGGFHSVRGILKQ